MQIKREFKIRDTDSFENHFFLKSIGVQVGIALSCIKNERQLNIILMKNGIAHSFTYFLKAEVTPSKMFAITKLSILQVYKKDKINTLKKWTNLK